MALASILGSLIVLKYKMAKFRYLKYLLLLTVALSAGCKKSDLEDNFFKSPTRQYDMAIEGGFNTLTSNQYIKLSKPSLNSDSVPLPISKASIVVNDGRADIVYKESATIPGLYVGSFRGDPNYNKPYKLTIKYNGKTYSAVDTLTQVVNIVDDFLPLSTHINAEQKVDGTIPKHTFGYLNPNKWYIDTIPSWNPSRFDKTNFYSYTHFLGSPNSLYPLNNLRRKFTVGPEQYIYIYKISLSSKYSQFLYSVFMETDWNGLFSSVPVNVEGNVSGNVQGYFSVVDVDGRRYRAKEL
jgi:hypothetical protein